MYDIKLQKTTEKKTQKLIDTIDSPNSSITERTK